MLHDAYRVIMQDNADAILLDDADAILLDDVYNATTLLNCKTILMLYCYMMLIMLYCKMMLLLHC